LGCCGHKVSGSSAGKDDGHGAEQDVDVKAEAPVFDVFEIEGDVAVEGWMVAGFYLPEACDARSGFETAEIFELILFDLGRKGRARANEAHIAFENVPKLREFIEAVLPHKTPGAGDAGIVDHLKEDAFALVEVAKVPLLMVRVHDHGAELVAGEIAAFLADAAGDIEDGTAGVELDD
jgi:hypothetical protein